MSRGCITFLTDFGTTDAYVAAMKGAALCVNPEATLVDISHEVPPHDVAAAAYLLAWAFPYFPPGTVHVAVVDPGVGSERRILAAEVRDQFLIAPDNGLLTIALAQCPPKRLISVTNAAYFRHPVSLTFHGRDVLAPVAAHLTLGVDLGETGRQVSDPVQLEGAGPRRVADNALEGTIIHADRFGNLVTNISRKDIEALDPTGGALVRVELADTRIEGVRGTYAEVPVGWLLAVVGSSGLLEVSANRRSAADLLGAGRGTPVRVARQAPSVAERPGL
ncbi:MAG: SAM-dependent chlorinase/fluorinase [Planctomycetes bacterium]|nr:SAM-dependent chlorinase/fluorinase [Planctomycetota bacterium]